MQRFGNPGSHFHYPRGPHGHRIRTGENAVNPRMSFEMPPEWGPHRGDGYSYTVYVKEVRQWCTITNKSQEQQASAVYSQLQGTAKAKIDTWLYVCDEQKRVRRQKRLKVGNRRYRIEQWETRLERQREEHSIRTAAQMEVDMDVWGRALRRGGGRRDEQQDEDDELYADIEEESAAGAAATAEGSAGDQPTEQEWPVFGSDSRQCEKEAQERQDELEEAFASPMAKAAASGAAAQPFGVHPRGRGMMRSRRLPGRGKGRGKGGQDPINWPTCNIRDTSSDESAGEKTQQRVELKLSSTNSKDLHQISPPRRCCSWTSTSTSRGRSMNRLKKLSRDGMILLQGC